MLFQKDNIYTVPNALSLSRIVISPFIAYSVVSDQHLTALALFGVAGVTDFVSSFSYLRNIHQLYSLNPRALLCRLFL